MAKNEFKVLDSDMHIIEPKDLWPRYIDAQFRDIAPRGVDRHHGDTQLDFLGHVVPDDPEDWTSEKAAETDEFYKDSYENGWDSASQVRAMDREGIDIAVLYPSRGLYPLAFETMDPVLGHAVARAYNDWMYDFCSHAPDRLYGAAMVSVFDVETAISEVRRGVKDMGIKGIFLRPNIVEGRNWHDPYYDPLWAEIESLDVPLGFHEGSNTVMPQTGDRFETYMMLHTVCHPMEMMLSVVSFIGGGILERFPKLKVGFLEANCAWVPWLLWRLDEHFELSGRFESPDLKLEPTDYFKRQCYASVEPDEEPAKFMEDSDLAGSMVFSTDYPHNDAKYPHATETFLEMPLSETSKKKILWDNCARMYGFS